MGNLFILFHLFDQRQSIENFFSFSYFLLYDGYNRTETLINQLLLAVKEIEERENIEIEIPKKNGAVSVSVWNWKFLKNKHPFISAWLEIEVLFK